jgi:prevent-host-death family protein
VKSVGSYEAKTHLPRLLSQVEKGETITITRRGKPIAVLSPEGKGDVLRERRTTEGKGDVANIYNRPTMVVFL